MVIGGCPYKENQKGHASETGLSKTPSQVSTLQNGQITEGAFNLSGQNLGLTLNRSVGNISIPSVTLPQSSGANSVNVSISGNKLTVKVDGHSDSVTLPSSSSATIEIDHFEVSSTPTGSSQTWDMYRRYEYSSDQFFSNNTAVSFTFYDRQGSYSNSKYSGSIGSGTHTLMNSGVTVDAPSNFTATIQIGSSSSRIWFWAATEDGYTRRGTLSSVGLEGYVTLKITNGNIGGTLDLADRYTVLFDSSSDRRVYLYPFSNYITSDRIQIESNV